MPKVSVILPTYNCDAYIKECMDSVLSQTFLDFELLIIDDQSTDNTVTLLKEYEDARIKLHIKEKNTGYTDSLNWAVQNAQSAYIARMDADDICHPDRFKKQVAYLDTHDDILLVGTYAEIIGVGNDLIYPNEPEQIMTTLLFGNPFVHPSVMGRISVFRDNPYDRTKEPAEDYDLWTRIALSGKVGNLAEKLIYYRVHDGQISNTKKEKQDASGRESMLRMFKLLHYDQTVFTDDFVKNSIWPHRNFSYRDLKKAIMWFNALEDKEGRFEKGLLEKALSRKQYNLLKFYVAHPERVDKPKRTLLLFIKMFPLEAAKYLRNK